MISFSLARSNRIRVAQAFANVPRVDISIECLIEDQMGQVFADSSENPRYFMIEQDNFFCYVAGDFKAGGQDFLKLIPHGRFLMAGSDGWAESLKTIFAENLIPVQRYQFSSQSLSVTHLDELAQNNPNTPHIKRIDAQIANIPNDFLGLGAFDSVDDFIERGIGFCMLDNDKVIGVAYSSLVCINAIEVSIIVDENHYRKGIATALACQLLKWCLDHHLAPHWDAANEESCKLAEKLGYTADGGYVAYYLK